LTALMPNQSQRNPKDTPFYYFSGARYFDIS
jgi:hypothetical protein